MKRAHVKQATRRSGHAQTPFLLAFFSVVAGAIGATLFCLRHREYSLLHKIRVFAVSPFFGLLYVVLCVATVLLLTFLGDRMQDFFARRKKK